MSVSVPTGASGAAPRAAPLRLPSIPFAARPTRGASSPQASSRHDVRRAAHGVTLDAGATLYEAGARAGMSWRIVSGALRLDLVQPDAARCVHLALAGDCVGIEALCGLPMLYRARAVTRSVARAVAVPCEAERHRSIGDAWARLLGEWLPTSGHQLGSGPSFERYLNNPGNAAPAELRTEICIPLA